MKVEFKIYAETQSEINEVAKFLMKHDCQCIGQVHIDEVTPSLEESASVPEPVATAPADTGTPAEAGEVVGADAPADTQVVDHAMVRALATELIKKNKSAGVNAIIKGVGASSIGKVPEDQLGSVYAQLKGLM